MFTRNGMREARIELSIKVLDSEDRVRKTLVHEMCHAAHWLMEGVRKPPHGTAFWRWAKVVTQRVPGLKVTRCHSYVIFYKFRYKCSSCNNTFGRHSKSVNLERQRCGRCKGKLELLGAFNCDGTKIASKSKPPEISYRASSQPQVHNADSESLWRWASGATCICCTGCDGQT